MLQHGPYFIKRRATEFFPSGHFDNAFKTGLLDRQDLQAIIGRESLSFPISTMY
jgi:hypothetical protein